MNIFICNNNKDNYDYNKIYSHCVGMEFVMKNVLCS